MTRCFLACLDVSFVVAKIVAMIGASIVALTLTTNAALAARLPGGFAHSGWFQFELVVLVDTRPAVLSSETWPLTTACLLYTSPSPRDQRGSRMPSSA